jgi:ribonuclease Z
LDIPLKERVKIKEGSDFKLPDGRVIPHAELTIPAEKPRSYAFCTDTIYHEPAIESIRGVDMLYHEATFANDMEDWAHKTYHSTAGEAATVAQKAEAKKLILGHFSARYKEIQPIVDEARNIFPESYPAEDGATFEIL